MTNDPRGSLWRRWDLHVHTPSSLEQHYGADTPETWEQFVSALESLPDEFAVLGINDYLFLDGYKKLLEFKAQGRLKNITTLLPVLEFRLDKFAGTDSHLRRVNFHVLFSNTLTTDVLEQQFLNRLCAHYTLSPSHGQIEWGGVVTRDSLADLGQRIIDSVPPERRHQYSSPLFEGFRNLNLTVDSIRAALDSPYFAGKYLTAVGKTEWTSVSWNDQSIAEKKTLINAADLVFIASETAEAYHNARATLSTQGVNNKLLDCSDAHAYADHPSKDAIGKCDTWIKADPTFRGLQHAVLEFDERVYVGSMPPKLADYRSHPNKYIDTVAVAKTKGSQLSEKWFGFELQLNPGLIAIIGNKGSGKSALADILALGGNSLQQQSFSFLNEQKFKQPRDNKAEHFAAELVWRSGDTHEYLLSDPIDPEDVERVRYIPQSYLEGLCNEFSADGGGAFDRELRSVIYSHIPAAERLGRASLGSLLEYLSEETLDRISVLRADLAKVNRAIALLESEAAPEYKRELDKKLAARLKELDTHNKSKPPEVTEPTADPEAKQRRDEISGQIAEQRRAIQELEGISEVAQQRRKELLARTAIAEKLIQRLQNLRTFVDELQKDSADELVQLGVAFDDVVRLTVDAAPLRTIRDECAAETQKIAKSLDPEIDDSAAAKLLVAKQELERLQSQLDAPTRRFQEYLSALKQWTDRAEAIKNDAEDPESIASLKAELARIASLPEQIRLKEAERLALSHHIYEQIADLKGHYRRLYRPVQEFMESHQTLAASIQLSFDVRIAEQGLVDTITDWIHQGKSGSFQGVDEGTKRLRGLVRRHSFDSKEGLEAFLTEFMQNLHEDVGKETPTKLSTQAQLKANRKTEDFYDFLFGLEYLAPRYSLQMDNKELVELSPGERGLLLLLFYLLVEKSEAPLVLDQPEENLDNETVHEVLVPSIRMAKERRQIVIVTHNPNLAVVSDADQIVAASIDKKAGCRVAYSSGALENADANQSVVRYLEGTMPAFMNRDQKYIRES